MIYSKKERTKCVTGIHSFRNDPDYAHQTCTRCGCKLVITYKNAFPRTIRTYFDKYGNKLDCIPTECKGLYDLLNDD